MAPVRQDPHFLPGMRIFLPVFREYQVGIPVLNGGRGGVPPLWGREEQAGYTVPPPGEPPVEDAGEGLRAREAEQDDGPPPSPQPGKDFGRGLFSRKHRSARQDQVYRLQAGAFCNLRKSPGEILRMAGEKLERIRRGISPDPVDRPAAHRAISVVDEGGFLRRRHAQHILGSWSPTG